MLRYLPLALLTLALPHYAQAQGTSQAQIVAACGTPNSTYVAGKTAALTQDTTGKLCDTATGGGGGGGAVTVADGADVTQGAIADTAATAGGTGTVSAKLREATALLSSLLATQTAVTPVVSTAAEASHVLKSGAGTLYSVYATAGATAGYLLVFNATSAPSDGAVTPIHCVPVAANNTTGISSAGGPADTFSTGITAVFSTTGCFTKTASATAFFYGSVQ